VRVKGGPPSEGLKTSNCIMLKYSVAYSPHAEAVEAQKPRGTRLPNSRGALPCLASLPSLRSAPQAHLPEGIYIAKTSFQGHQEVPLSGLNATHREQVRMRGSLAHCEPVALVTPQCNVPNRGMMHQEDSKKEATDMTVGGVCL
jgi:hypothetical protein